MKIGVLGGGQLGRMLGLAGIPLGLKFRFFDPAIDSPAQAVGEFIAADYGDTVALARFASGLDLVTYEFENVPVSATEFLSSRLPIFPSINALRITQDRLTEKQLFERLEIPTPKFIAVQTGSELRVACETIGYPAIVKTRRLGYDGKGQAVVRSADELQIAERIVEQALCIVEQLIPFERELSIIAVRARSGETATYPLTETLHRNGILRRTISPAPDLLPELTKRANHYAALLLKELGYVGVICLELFQWNDRLYANEIAPRVHNSGHWSIEGAVTSQFENHLRAICDLPLGLTRVRSASAMLNMIGTLPDTRAILSLPDVYLHLYDKAPRPHRKLGHVTICAEDSFVVQTLLHHPALLNIFRNGE